MGGLQAKINFLQTCLLNDVIPKGFNINWKERTGLNCPSLSSKISEILISSSKLLLQEVLESFKLDPWLIITGLVDDKAIEYEEE